MRTVGSILVVCTLLFPGCLLLSDDSEQDQSTFHALGNFSTHAVGNESYSALFIGNSSAIVYNGPMGMAFFHTGNMTIEQVIQNVPVQGIASLDQAGIMVHHSTYDGHTVIGTGTLDEYPIISEVHQSTNISSFGINSNGTSFEVQPLGIRSTTNLSSLNENTDYSSNQHVCTNGDISLQSGGEIHLKRTEDNLISGHFGPFDFISSFSVSWDCSMIAINDGKYVHVWSSNNSKSVTIETEARPPEIDEQVLVVEQNTEEEVTSDEQNTEEEVTLDEQNTEEEVTLESNLENEVNSPDFTIDEPFSVRLGAIELGLYDLLSLAISITLLSLFIEGRRTGSVRVENLLAEMQGASLDELRILEKKIERLSLFKMLTGFQIARLAERMNIERENFSSDESE